MRNDRERMPAFALLKELSRIASDNGGFDWRFSENEDARRCLSRMDEWVAEGPIPLEWADMYPRELTQDLMTRVARATRAISDHPEAGRALEEFIRLAAVRLQDRIHTASETPGWKLPSSLAVAVQQLDAMLGDLASARRLAARSDKTLRRYAEAIARHGYQDVFRHLGGSETWTTFDELEAAFPNRDAYALIRELVFPENDGTVLFLHVPNGRVDEDGRLRGSDYVAATETGARLVSLLPRSAEQQPST